MDDACVPAETLFVSVADGLGFANRSCVFPAPAFAEEYVPMGRVGRCELLGGAEAVGSDEGHGAITLTGASPSPTTWDARAGCGVPPLVSFVDGATMTVDVAAHGCFPAASATLLTPGPLEGVLLPTSIVLGEPLALGWIQGPEGAAGQIEVVLLTREPTRRIRCVDVPDTGAFRVPAEATAALVDATRVGVSIVRSAREHLTPPGSGVSIEIALVRATVADIPVAVPTP